MSGGAKRAVSGTPGCDLNENRTGVAQKEAAWCILAGIQETKRGILA